MYTIENKGSLVLKNVKYFMTIDPGLNGHTGYAIFNPKLTINPVKTGTCEKRKKTEDWQIDVIRITSEIEKLSHNCQQVFIELPEFWGQSGKSYASTASGDLFKLTFLVGSLFSVCTSKFICCNLLKPREWKGQLSKEQVDRRILHTLKEKYSDHISDAVGIGLYIMGLL